jgi:guanylate kinase
MSGLVFIVSAPSGSGKSTLTAEMLRLVPGLEFSISYTTRRPRGSERNGVEYFFVPREDFERMIRKDEFLEHACVFGDYYGTSGQFVESACKRGNDLLLDIDVQGAAQVKRRLPGAVSIFILPPSRMVLENRLRRRSEAEKVFDEPVISRRLNAAGREIENYANYDYILVNDQLDLSIDQLKAIISAERLKRSGRVLSAEERSLVETADCCRLENVRDRVQQILATFQERGEAQQHG